LTSKGPSRARQKWQSPKHFLRSNRLLPRRPRAQPGGLPARPSQPGQGLLGDRALAFICGMRKNGECGQVVSNVCRNWRRQFGGRRQPELIRTPRPLQRRNNSRRSRACPSRPTRAAAAATAAAINLAARPARSLNFGEEERASAICICGPLREPKRRMKRNIRWRQPITPERATATLESPLIVR